MALWLMGVVAPAATLELDTSTTLLNSSLFSTGTTYVAAFQLNGAGNGSTLAALSLFDLGGGSGLPASPADLTAGLFSVGPLPALSAGIWQSNGMLTLNVDPLNVTALYTQAFTAGTVFRFDFLLTTNVGAGLTPDQFSFQLYDSGLSELLYDSAFDAVPGVTVPEPGTMSLCGAMGVLVWLIRSKASRRPGPGGRV
ncbi:MAG: hypothetical protein K2X03_05875 [Bryobacteraceae bacterium]|nr:hypothetical protein [Bryobacteraceae bacterium]